MIFYKFFSKGSNFCDFLTMQPFQNRVYSSRKEFAPKGANSFLYELTPHQMGGKNKSKRAAFFEIVTIHLKLNRNTFSRVFFSHTSLEYPRVSPVPVNLTSPSPQVTKQFSCSTQLSMKF